MLTCSLRDSGSACLLSGVLEFVELAVEFGGGRGGGQESRGTHGGGDSKFKFSDEFFSFSLSHTAPTSTRRRR